MSRPFVRRAGESSTSAARHNRILERIPLPFRGGCRHVFLCLGADAEYCEIAIAMVWEIAVNEGPAPAAHLVEARQRIHRIALDGTVELHISGPLRNDATAARTSTSASCRRPVRVSQSEAAARPAATITAEPAAPIR
jgi:hypothetical protein